MPVSTLAPHIWTDDQRRAWIDDANVKVIEIVLDHVAYGWSAEEIHAQHSHLSLGQIYGALACYYDHQAEFDLQIEQSRRRAGGLAAEASDSPLRLRLRAAGKLWASRSIMDVHVPAVITRTLMARDVDVLTAQGG